jgi:hypothetical protein
MSSRFDVTDDDVSALQHGSSSSPPSSWTRSNGCHWIHYSQRHSARVRHTSIYYLLEVEISWIYIKNFLVKVVLRAAILWIHTHVCSTLITTTRTAAMRQKTTHSNVPEEYCSMYKYSWEAWLSFIRCVAKHGLPNLYSQCPPTTKTSYQTSIHDARQQQKTGHVKCECTSLFLLQLMFFC